MDNVTIHVLSVLAMFILHLICGLVPLCLLRPSLTTDRRFVAAQGVFSCVAAGIFIGEDGVDG